MRRALRNRDPARDQERALAALSLMLPLAFALGRLGGAAGLGAWAAAAVAAGLLLAGACVARRALRALRAWLDDVVPHTHRLALGEMASLAQHRALLAAPAVAGPADETQALAERAAQIAARLAQLGQGMVAGAGSVAERAGIVLAAVAQAPEAPAGMLDTVLAAAAELRAEAERLAARWPDLAAATQTQNELGQALAEAAAPHATPLDALCDQVAFIVQPPRRAGMRLLGEAA